jgi:hypothetical protein
MLHLSFTEEDIQELGYLRYHHPHPRVQRKMEALLLKARDYLITRLPRVLGSVKIRYEATWSSIRQVA